MAEPAGGSGGGRPNDRGQGVYDRWSRHPVLLKAFYTAVFGGREDRIRRLSVDALDLSPGDRVLELGCGPGNSFDRLRERVGSGGRVVGLDYSAGMVRAARQRVRERGWGNVAVLRGDATRPPVADGSFDAVYAAMSISAMPDQRGVVTAARDALSAGGRMAVLDSRPFQSWPLSALNPVIVRVSNVLTNWRPDEDVPGVMGETFGRAAVANFQDGTLFVAVARRSDH